MPRNIKTLIVVSENNTTMEREIDALCPELAPIPVAQVKRPARSWRICPRMARRRWTPSSRLPGNNSTW
jgi:hypothetical protein